MTYWTRRAFADFSRFAPRRRMPCVGRSMMPCLRMAPEPAKANPLLGRGIQRQARDIPPLFDVWP